MGKKSEKKAPAEEMEPVDSAMPSTNEQLTYEDKVALALPIAHPMASRKVAKKCFKAIKKARGKGYSHLIRGLKAVQKAIKTDQKGFVILAGDTDPMDVISHLPCFCESHKIPYVWVPSQTDLGHAATAGRAIVYFVKPDESYKKYYDEAYEAIKDLPIPL